MTNASKQDLEQLKQRLVHRLERSKVEVSQYETDLRAVNRALELLGQGETQNNFVQLAGTLWDEAYLSQFDGLTQIQALVKFARDSGHNRLKVSDAKQLFIAAHLSKSRKNITNILHSTLDRSDKFTKVSPGEYELLPDANEMIERVAAGEKPARVIDQYLRTVK